VADGSRLEPLARLDQVAGPQKAAHDLGAEFLSHPIGLW